MKRILIITIIVLFIALAVFFIQESRRLSRDSTDAWLASEIRVELQGWFEETSEYPKSLEDIWTSGRMRSLRQQFEVPDDRIGAFGYTSRSNTYRLVYTNFGNIYLETGTNGTRRQEVFTTIGAPSP
jgi:hypothetical protein